MAMRPYQPIPHPPAQRQKARLAAWPSGWLWPLEGLGQVVQRIAANAVVDHLEVEVVARAVARAAHIPQYLALGHLLPLDNVDAAHVRIEGLYASRADDDDVETVGTAGVAAGEGNDAGSGGQDRRVRAGVLVDVDAQGGRRIHVAG